MRKSTLFIIAGLTFGTTAALSLGYAFSDTPNTPEQTTIVVAEIPSPPPSLAPFRIATRANSLFIPDDLAETPAAEAGHDGGITIASYGVLGVSLAGEDSYATLQTPDGIHTVNMKTIINGHHIRTISLMGITLDDGTIIPRGLAVDSGATPAPVSVPGIGTQQRVVPQQNQGVVNSVFGTPPLESPQPQATATPYGPTFINPQTLSTPSVINGNPGATQQ